MKIAHVLVSLEERFGGTSVSVPALADAVARAGHAVDVFTTGPVSRRLGAARIHSCARDWPERIGRSAELSTALRNSGAEIIHHHALWLRTLHYAHQSKRLTGARFVLSPRGMMAAWSWRHHRGRKFIAQQFIHPGAFEAVDGWHATSVEEEREIRALGFTQPVGVVPNGVNAPDESAVAAAAQHWKAACPAANDRPVALFYSRFHSKKRILELIDLWLDQGPANWQLLLVGIPEEFTVHSLEQYVLRRSGGGRVLVYSGAGHPPPYAIASLFLLPSHNENFGLVIAEAMAHGVPVLVTDTTPWRGVNINQRGWCVSWEDYPQALRTATADSADTLRERGARAKSWVLQEYSWDRSAARLLEFYGSLRRSPA